MPRTMLWICTGVWFVCLAVSGSSVIAEPDQELGLTLGVDVVSAYVYAGETLNDGPVVQPYAEFSGWPVTLGIWANFDLDDYNGAANEDQVSEIDFTAAYEVPLPIEVLTLEVGYTEYMYPGVGDAAGDFVVGLTYIGQGKEEILPDGEGSYDVDVVGKIGIAKGF